MSKILLGLILIFLSSGLLVAQKYSFVTYNTDQGLSQSQVTSICQDELGYLWIGTIGGLDRFNGDDFVQYSESNGLFSNRINTLTFIQRALYVGHDGGVSKMVNEEITILPFVTKMPASNLSVSKIIQFKGEIYVCTNGAGLFVIKDDKVVEIKTFPENHSRIKDVEIVDDKIYLATNAGLLYSENGKDFSEYNVFKDKVCSGVCSDKNYLTVSTFNEGVYRINLKSSKVFTWDNEALNTTIYGCYADRNNRVWLKSLEGIIRIETNNKLSRFTEENGVPIDMISCYYNDSEGNVWIGSQGKGFFRFPRSSFEYYDKSFGLPSELVLTGFQDKRDAFYLGTYDKGVVVIEPNGDVYELNTIQNTIWSSVQNVNGKHWFGSNGSLISVDQKGNHEEIFLEDEPNLPGAKVTSFFKVNSKEMYLGGIDGVSYYNRGEFSKIETSISTGTVRDFARYQGEIYFSSELGLFKLVGDSVDLVLEMSRVYSIEAWNDTELWLGTDVGLFVWKQDTVQVVKTMNDVSSKFNNFLNYKKGIMYAGTNNGLFQLSKNNDSIKVLRFGIGDGLVDLETNINSGFFDSKGDLWFGTASGLVNYQLSDKRKKIVQPKLILKEIKVNYKAIDYELYSDSLNEYGLPSSLNLPAAKNNILFELDGISLSHRKGVRYQYKLIGQYDNWSDSREEPSILFTNLEAGDYILKVRAVDFNGNFSKELSFPFTIATPFYKTWWFFLMSIVVFAGGIYGVLAIRIKKETRIFERKQLENKSKLIELEQKSINASMNRHFIFNSLNSIQYFINRQDRLSANKYLTDFAKLIRKNLDAANAKDGLVSLEEEIDRIKLYLALEMMRFNDKFDYELNISDEVDAESLMIPPMIMQPFIENSIIHGILPNKKVKGKIEVNIYPENNTVKILIKDNGIGLSASRKNKSTNEGDHRSMGMEITSKRVELMREDSVNHVEIIGPVDRYNSSNEPVGTQVVIILSEKSLFNDE